MLWKHGRIFRAGYRLLEHCLHEAGTGGASSRRQGPAKGTMRCSSTERHPAGTAEGMPGVPSAALPPKLLIYAVALLL